ncbi:MAG: tyrosine-type recombinase/integrase [Tenacibaculum sp.]|nr:tyrosine-type recombinase/integrase [Tenacibaculum sp.]
MFISSFLEYLKCEKNYSNHTILAYKTDLISFRDFCITEFNQENITSIHYNQIRSWIVSMVNQEISNRTINRKISTLKTFYKFLQKTGGVKINPLAKHKALKAEKKVQVPFTKNEVKNVINCIDVEDDSFTNIRNKLIVELFYSTGMRRIELVDLKVKDINIYDKTIKVLGKRNKERYVPLLPSVLETLNNYLVLRKQCVVENEENLLITLKGVKIYETLVYRIIISYFSGVSTKVKKSPHILRHTFATHLLNQGADLNSVKELLGHSSLAATQVYTHNSLEQLKKVFNKAHPRSEKTK